MRMRQDSMFSWALFCIRARLQTFSLPSLSLSTVDLVLGGGTVSPSAWVLIARFQDFPANAMGTVSIYELPANILRMSQASNLHSAMLIIFIG